MYPMTQSINETICQVNGVEVYHTGRYPGAADPAVAGFYYCPTWLVGVFQRRYCQVGPFASPADAATAAVNRFGLEWIEPPVVAMIEALADDAATQHHNASPWAA
jgi:hypothetical protein